MERWKPSAALILSRAAGEDGGAKIDRFTIDRLMGVPGKLDQRMEVGAIWGAGSLGGGTRRPQAVYTVAHSQCKKGDPNDRTWKFCRTTARGGAGAS